MFFLEGNGKPIDDRTENFQQFPNPIVAFGFIHEPIKDIGNGTPDKRPMGHKFAIDAMENGFEIISFPWIFGIKQFHQLQTKFLIDKFFGRFRIDFRRNNKPEKEFIRHLEMGPRGFQDGFIFFGIKIIRRGWQRTTDIGGHHPHQITHDTFGKNLLSRGGIDIIDQFQEGLSFHILAPFVSHRILKTENHGTQFEFENKQFFAFRGRSIPQRR
mmetsp:Transcript_28079/g.30266  ORF Transcript_28079/g.30266 Transcript_28079/m.30266 type:complete len:214 (+) Transcript_28079:878-1519(+)